MTTPDGIALIYVPAEVDPVRTFTGRTLVDRSQALARAAGLAPFLVASPDDAAGLGTGVPPRAAEGSLPADGGSEVVLMRCDVGCVAAALRQLRSEGPGRHAARDDAGRVALLRVRGDALERRVPASLEAPAEGARSPSPAGRVGRHRLLALGFAARTVTESEAAGLRARAEADLLASLENPRDGFVDRVLNRRLSRPLSRALLAYPVTPNLVTVAALALAVAGATLLALPGTLWPVAGALVLQLTAVLDCVDGEIARAKVLESEWGEWLDITADTLIHVAVFLGIAVHAWPSIGAGTAWLLAALFTTGGLASFVVVTRAERTEDEWKASGSWQGRLLGTLLITLTTRDSSVLVLVAAATGLLEELLLGAAVGAQVFWVTALLLHSAAMRHDSRPRAATAAPNSPARPPSQG